jgi:carboxylesterase
MSKLPFGVLILHGFASSLDSVKEIEGPLTALGLPCRLPILNGHGKASPEALRGITWRDWLEDAKSALDNLLIETEKVIVIGHSMGGLLALNLAMTHGDQLDSIILGAAAIQLAVPFSPGKPLYFLTPLVPALIKKLDLPPVYTDPSLVKYDTNYHWAPTDATVSFLNLVRFTRKSLANVNTPTLILQSRKDTTVDSKSPDIIYIGISTPADQKRIVWFEKTEHEMFRDCEREAIIDVITRYVKERIGVK